MKKYIIISLAALCAMCACTKVEPNEVNEAISFSAAPYSAATKAAGTGSDAFEVTGNTSFGVFAYYNVEKGFAATTNAYINGVEVLHNPGKTGETADDWAPAQDYYWPKTGYLTFVGWAPFAQTATYDKTNGIQWANWTIITAPNATAALGTGNQTDLMYTVVDTDTQDLQSATGAKYGHTGVPMLFHHALAKLNFTVEYDMTGLNDDQKKMFKVQVTDITLKTLGNKASFSNKVWGTPAASADQKLAGTSDELSSTSATQDDYVEDYFIIPQTPVQLEVNYKINGVACDKVTLDLKTTNITDWVENYVYTYNLKISPITDVKITFDPSVAAWADPITEDIDVENVTPSTK